MPTYEYRCQRGHNFEVVQRMTDDPVAVCETCDAPVQRVFHPVAVHFKGKGFYNTDYGTRRRNREMEKSADSGADKTADNAKDKKDSTTTTASESSSSKSESSSKPAADKPAAKKTG